MNAHISATANIFRATHYTPTAMSTRRPPEAPVCETASIMRGVQFKPPSSMVHTDRFLKDHDDFTWRAVGPLHGLVEAERVVVNKIINALQEFFGE